MKRRFVAAAACAAAAGAGVLTMAAPAIAAPNGGVCQLTGTANFGGAGLTVNSSPFTYNFSGTLTNCHSGTSSGLNGGPTGGTIQTVGSGTYNALGNGGCASSTTSGVAVVNWNDGDTSVVKYTTTGAAAAVVQQGSVVSSYQYQSGTDSLGNPVYTTYTTNEPATPVGDSAGGVLTFNPGSPTACQTGVSTAAINGAIGTGSDS